MSLFEALIANIRKTRQEAQASFESTREAAKLVFEIYDLLYVTVDKSNKPEAGELIQLTLGVLEEVGRALISLQQAQKEIDSLLVNLGTAPGEKTEVLVNNPRSTRGCHRRVKASDKVLGFMVKNGLGIYPKTKVKAAADWHYEDMVRERTGGVSMWVDGREKDSVTSEAIIEAKRGISALNQPENFLKKETKEQISHTISSAHQRGLRAEFWFKYGVHPKIRRHIEKRGGIVVLGLGG